jgi:hypothetical protein
VQWDVRPVGFPDAVRQLRFAAVIRFCSGDRRPDAIALDVGPAECDVESVADAVRTRRGR